ncbi:hypothetical protein L7F22_026192 [Adiantum nelumboides]|nr:hypothetical protein [Adiantum nelumboides]
MSAVLALPQVKDFLKTLAKWKEKGQEEGKEHDVNAHALTEEGEPSKKPWNDDIPELSSPSYSPLTSFSYSSDSSSSSNPRRRRHFLIPATRSQLLVDTSSGETIKIYLNITFPNLACSILSLDAMDVSGEQHLDVKHDIFKRRLDSLGRVLEPPKPEQIGGAQPYGCQMHWEQCRGYRELKTEKKPVNNQKLQRLVMLCFGQVMVESGQGQWSP